MWHLYVNRRYPEPDAPNQDGWALQWGFRGRGPVGTRFKPPISTHRTRKLACQARDAIEAADGRLEDESPPHELMGPMVEADSPWRQTLSLSFDDV